MTPVTTVNPNPPVAPPSSTNTITVAHSPGVKTVTKILMTIKSLNRLLIVELLDCLQAAYPDLQIIKDLGSGQYANVFLCEYTQADGTVGKIALKLPSWSKAEKTPAVYQWSKDRAGGEFLALLVGDDEHVNQTTAVLVYNRDTKKFELITAEGFRARYKAPNETPSYQLVGSLSQYHEGTVDLKAYLKNNTLSGEKILSVAKQILQGLEEIHVKGLAHRDIKPTNVLISPDGKIKLIDLGFAAKASRQPLSPRGTALYYSSDRVSKMSMGNYDHYYKDGRKEDIYALGVLLFELVTGGKAMCEDDRLKWFTYHRACAINMTGLGNHSEIQRLQNPDLKHLITQLGLCQSSLRPSAAEALRYSYFQ